MKSHFFSIFLLIVLVSCEKSKDTGPVILPELGRYSEIYTGGQFHEGPVDWEETKWTNAFGPYPEFIREIEGRYLAGLELSHNGKGEICDACIKIETGMGKSLVLRVVTTGYTSKNSIDVSPEAYAILNSGEYPRSMSWYVTKCPSNGHNIYYQFKTDCNPWWVALWPRNVALPIAKVEVKSAVYSEWSPLIREGDGSWVDYKGFREKPFKIRVTAIDGSTVEDSYNSYVAGGLLESSGQF